MGLFTGSAGAVPTVVLEPLPWAEAGFVGKIHVDLNGSELELGPTSSVVLDGNGVHFEATLVSRAIGHRWEYGIEDISFSTMEESAYFSIDFVPFASFAVPFDGIHPTSPVAFDLDYGGTDDDEIHESAMGLDWVNHYVAGDLVRQTGFGSIYWSISLNSGAYETTSPCGSGPGLLLDDCVSSVEIFSPIVVDGHRHPGVAEPGTALLVGAGAAVGLGARRRRR
jgi:hypothetical protein